MNRTMARSYAARGLLATVLCWATTVTGQITTGSASPASPTVPPAAATPFVSSPSATGATTTPVIIGTESGGPPTLNSTPANSRASADAANARASASVAADQQRGGASPP